MGERVIEIGSGGCSLRVRQQQLIIRRDHEELASIPIEDLAAVVIDHPQTMITQICLGKLLEANVMVVTSDVRHQPVGLFLPLNSNTLQTERFNAQASLKKPIAKRLWKTIVRAKLRMQAKVLMDLRENDGGIGPLVSRVRSGDPDNLEAQAARRYWQRLFDDKSFRRDRDADDANRYLNYGYAILRALTARSLCAAGLHPSLGIHHRNRYNAYCLADDLMEPYRPFVDALVVTLVQDSGDGAALDQTLRQRLLELVKQPVCLAGEQSEMLFALTRSAQSLSKVVLGESEHLLLPEP